MSETRSPGTQSRAGPPPPIPDPRPSPETVRRRRFSGAVLFYSVLAVVLGAYTLLAFDMEWSTQAGRIGPGFFPRIIGVAGVALALIGLATSLRSVPAAETDGTEPGGHHPALIAVIGLALTGFVTVFIPVGAPLTAAAFLLLMYFLIDRRYIVRRIVLSLAFPLFLYVLFEAWLNAGLPAGLTAFL